MIALNFFNNNNQNKHTIITDILTLLGHFQCFTNLFKLSNRFLIGYLRNNNVQNSPTLITLIIHSEFNKVLGRNDDHAQMKQSPPRAEYCTTGREERK